MENNKESVVLALKTKRGENILGFFCGEAENPFTKEPSFLLYRPIMVNHINYAQNGGKYHNYISDFYFPYGDRVVRFNQKDVISLDQASEFFSRYYKRVLGEHIVDEEKLQNRIDDMYENKDIAEILAERKSDSFYINLPRPEFLS